MSGLRIVEISNTIRSTSGVHIQNIENYQKEVKKFKTLSGVHSHQLASYLDEFMWRERYGTTSEQAFDSILRDISVLCDVSL